MTIVSYYFLLLIMMHKILSLILNIDIQFLNTIEYINTQVQTPCTNLKITGNTALNYNGPCQNQFSYSLDIDLDSIEGTKFEFTIDSTNRGYEKTCYVKGDVYVDGYTFKIKRNSLFFSPSLSDSGAFSNWKYFHPSSGNSGTFSFEILDDVGLLGKNPDSFTKQFICHNKDYVLSYNTTASPFNVELNIEKTVSTQTKEVENIIFKWNTDNTNSLCQSTEDTQISNFTQVPYVIPFKYYINSDNKDTYYESVTFAVYRNSLKNDCEEKTLTFLVCGINCKQCQGSESLSRKCT